MADNSYPVRRNKKVAGVDDPVIIIQRILNIFRQRHILDEQQIENFNNMILQQPPEIRHMCNILPGGSLLQEYVDELEESRGIAPDQNLNSSNGSNENTILANALNATEVPSSTPSPQESSTSPQVSNEEFQKQMLLMMQTLKNSAAPAPAAGGTITADANFAKEIAKAISQALAESDEKRREETQAMTKSLTDSQMQMTKALVSQMMKTSRPAETNTVSIAEDGSHQAVKIIDNTEEITKAITESQLEMAKMFLQQNAINSANISSNNAANNIQINNAVPQFDHKTLISDLIKAQSLLFKELNKTQTKELAILISDAIKESSKLSNKSLTEALASFQKENLKFLEKQAKNQNAKVVYYQAPAAGETGTPLNIPPAYIPEQEAFSSQESSPSYIKKMFGNVFNKVKSTESEDVSLVQDPVTEEPTTPTMPTEKVVEAPIQEAEEITPDEPILETNLDSAVEENPFSETKKKKKKKKKNKNKNSLENSGNESVGGYTPIYAEDKSTEETVAPETRSSEPVSSVNLDSSLFDFDTPITEDVQNFSLDEDELPDLSDIESDNISNQMTEETLPEVSPEVAVTTPEIPVQVPEKTIEENIFASAPSADITPPTPSMPPKTEPRISTSDFLKNIKEKISSGELFNRNETSDTDAPIDLDDTINSSAEIEDDTSVDNDEDLVDNITADNEDEWAWEYEEVTEDTAADDTEVLAEDAATEGDGEWEWEYEEVAEDAAADDTEVLAEDAATEGDGEWEWEYEEVAEDTAADDTEVLAEDAATEGDGEWEWEYEEVAEDTAADDTEVLTEDATAEGDGEWEWEYEETDDETSSENTETFEELSESEDKQFSNKDPYAGESEENDLDFTSLQSGSLYFQEDINVPVEDEEEQLIPVQETSEPEIVFSELGENDEQDEPYHINSETKP